MRIMALNALEPGLGTFDGVPVSVPATVDARLPITVGGAVAFGAEQDDVGLGDFRAVVIDKRVAVGGMMAVEAKTVCAMFELDVLVLGHGAVIMPLCRQHFVALHTIIGPIQRRFHQDQSMRFARGGGQSRAGGKYGLFGARASVRALRLLAGRSGQNRLGNRRFGRALGGPSHEADRRAGHGPQPNPP